MRRITAPAALAALLVVVAVALPAHAQRARTRTRARASARAPEPTVLADLYLESGRAAALWLTPAGVRIQPLDARFAPDGPALVTGIPTHALAPAARGRRGGCRDTLRVTAAMLARDASTGGWQVVAVQQRVPCRPELALAGALPEGIATAWRPRGARFVADPEPLRPSGVISVLHRPGETLSFTDAAGELVQVGRDGAVRTTDLNTRLRGIDREHPVLVTGWGPGAFLVAPPDPFGSPRWFELDAAGDLVGEVTLPMGNPDVVAGTQCVPTATDWACARGGSADVMFVPRAGDSGMPARVGATVHGPLVPAGGTAVYVLGEDETGARYQLVDRNGTRSAVHEVAGLTGVRLVALAGGRVLLAGVSGRGRGARMELRVEGGGPGGP